MANQFLVSVADVIGRDATTGAVLFLGKANISSSFSMATAKTEVRGGINNPLLFTYYHDRTVEVNIEGATFDKSLLALNAGTSITNSTYSVVKSENVTLASGSGWCTETPTSSTVGVLLSTGTIQTVTPSGSQIWVSGGGTQSVTAIYNYSETSVDELIGLAINPPTGIELIMTSEVRDATNTKVYDFQIIVPNFNISGNYTMSLAANGVSSQSINGTANVTVDAAGDYYYKARWLPSAGTSIVYTDIAATPSVITFDVGNLPDTHQISVLGIRGGLYANVNVLTSCSFVKTTGCAMIYLGATNGLVTAGSNIITGGSALITVTYWDATSGSVLDTVTVRAVA